MSRFEGKAITEWHDNGRDMTLLSELRFVDPDGRHWIAPPGEVINGASVPRFFWRLMPPFQGTYRFASIIHDAACSAKVRNSRLTHAMFYHAMRASGVCRWQAWLMWLAVATFGPKWECSASCKGGSCNVLP